MKSTQKSKQNTKENLFFKILLQSKNISFVNCILQITAKDGENLLRHCFTTNKKTYNWTITKVAKEALSLDVRTKKATHTFISDLLEEYVEMPFGKREKIMLSDKIEQINYILKTGFPFEYISGGGILRIMHPYQLTVDPDLQYNYLIGHTVEASDYDYDTFEPQEVNVGTIRIFNLRKDSIRLLNNQNVKIDKKAIIHKLSHTSAPFLADDLMEITVLLNKQGEQLYRSIIHNRPQYKERSDDYNEDGWRKYVFECNIFRSTIYFCSFHGNAKVISPPQAVSSIKEHLKASYMLYNEE